MGADYTLKEARTVATKAAQKYNVDFDVYKVGRKYGVRSHSDGFLPFFADDDFCIVETILPPGRTPEMELESIRNDALWRANLDEEPYEIVQVRPGTYYWDTAPARLPSNGDARVIETIQPQTPEKDVKYTIELAIDVFARSKEEAIEKAYAALVDTEGGIRDGRIIIIDIDKHC